MTVARNPPLDLAHRLVAHPMLPGHLPQPEQAGVGGHEGPALRRDARLTQDGRRYAARGGLGPDRRWDLLVRPILKGNVQGLPVSKVRCRSPSGALPGLDRR